VGRVYFIIELPLERAVATPPMPTDIIAGADEYQFPPEGETEIKPEEPLQRLPGPLIVGSGFTLTGRVT